MCGLVRLESLRLGSNRITELPHGIKQLSRLEVLGVAGNALRSLPEVIWTMPSLRVLDFSSNKLVGLSSMIRNLHGLESLDVSRNRIRKTPPSIGRARKLAYLDVSGNPLIELPNTLLGLCKSIKQLGIDGDILGPGSYNCLGMDEIYSVFGERVRFKLSTLPFSPKMQRDVSVFYLTAQVRDKSWVFKRIKALPAVMHARLG